MAVLQVAPHGVENLTSVRLAPTYDTVTTRVFPGLEDDHLAFSLAGKRNWLSSNDFVRAGVTMGLSAESARNIVVSLCGRLSTHLNDLDLASDRVGPVIEVWIS